MKTDNLGGHKTAWNRKLIKYAGARVNCSELQKNGLTTDYYIVNDDGSLSFGNDLRSLNVRATMGQFKNYWTPKEKSCFLKILRGRKGEQNENLQKHYN